MGKCLTELLVFEQIAVEGRFFFEKRGCYERKNVYLCFS